MECLCHVLLMSLPLKHEQYTVKFNCCTLCVHSYSVFCTKGHASMFLFLFNGKMFISRHTLMKVLVTSFLPLNF